MPEERIADPTGESPAIDPPGTTVTEQVNLDAPTTVTGAAGDGAIDPPGTT